MYTTITINQKPYELRFGFGANRILAESWGFKTLSQIGKKLSETFDFSKEKEVTLDQIEIIGQLAQAGIKNANPTAEVDLDSILDALLSDVSLIEKIVKGYAASLPKPVPEGNEKRG